MTSTLAEPPASHDELSPGAFGLPDIHRFDEELVRPPWRVLIGAIVLCAVTSILGAQGAVVVELLKEEEWQAVSEVEFRDPALLPETVAVTLESPSIWHPVAVAEGLSDEEFQKHYDASVAGGTQIIQVTFIDPDPDRARRVTNAVVENYVTRFATTGVDDQREVITDFIESLRELEASIVTSLDNSDRLALPVQIDLQSQLVRTRQQINDLTLRLVQQQDEDQLRTQTDPRVVSAGFVFDEPVTPAPLKALVFGAAAGGLIGLLLSYLAFHRTAMADPATAAAQGRRSTEGPGHRGSALSTSGGGHTTATPTATATATATATSTSSSTATFASGAAAVDDHAYPTESTEWPVGTRSRMVAKRTIDVVISFLLLVLTAPLLLLLVLAVKLTSRGPALFRQVRVGKNGRPFEMIKFRSMYVNNDDSAHRAHLERLLSGDDAMPEADGSFKLDDPRITRVGKILRRLSLDELPQLWNVLRGDMSLVGPRPALPWEHRLFGERDRARVMASPGCSGLWQVSGRSTLSTSEMLDLDLEYVWNWSLRRDLFILIRTPLALIRGDGAR